MLVLTGLERQDEEEGEVVGEGLGRPSDGGERRG